MEEAKQNLVRKDLPQQLTKCGAKQGIEIIENQVKSGALTFEKAIQGKQISHYKRVLGEMDLGIQITKWIVDLSLAYNIKGRITDEQAPFIANVIMKDFWWLKLAELALFFDQAKSGKFGKVYDRLDQAIIIEWLTVYDQREREYALEKMRTKNLTISQKEAAILSEKLFKPLERMKEEIKQEQKEQATVESRDRKNLIIDYQKLATWFPRELEQIELTIIRWHERRDLRGFEIQHVVLSQFMNYRKVKILLEKIKRK